MIIHLKQSADTPQKERLKAWLEDRGLEIQVSVKAGRDYWGLLGDTGSLDTELIRALNIVDDVKRINEPYKNANRIFHPEDTVIDIDGVKVGGGSLTLIAGPCSVESEEQMKILAREVKAAGANMLRGGAFKPRTSPYSFQGMGADGIELLLKAKEITGLPIVSEVMDISQIPLFKDVDILQVGTRNMQNFELLKELGKLRKPILLKRGLSATYQEWLMSAEYIMAGGNHEVILCERGIRTFETETRNTLDISAIPMLKEMTHLPIIIDPSHAAGIRELVHPLTMAGVAIGADGVMIEVHNDPEKALCDGPQCLRPASFSEVTKDARKLHAYCHESGIIQ